MIAVTHHLGRDGWDFEFGHGESRDSGRTLHESVDAAERAVRMHLSARRGYEVPLDSARREMRHITGASAVAPRREHGAQPAVLHREWR